ncbi:hypothetical protein ACFLQW_04380 [Candidatus Zixiibacteriota bacterium]
MDQDIRIKFLRDFLCAGSSALLISVAHFYPEYWFVSLFALVPFLWRAACVGLLESIVLGGILATSYCFVTAPIALWLIPSSYVLKLLALNVLFALYAVAVNRLSRHIGFNAICMALLWLPLEFMLSHYTHLGSIFAFSETDSTLLIRVGSLFGILMVSFVVVLINSLILIFLGCVVRELAGHSDYPHNNNLISYPPFRYILRGRNWFYFPDRRSPPLHALG